jgi:hypothetical protein
LQKSTLMKYLITMARLLFLVIIFFCCSSWGFLVHRVISQLAVYELPKKIEPFFFRNIDYLVTESIRPDIRRNTDPGEIPKHFIDLENYGDSAAWKMPMNWQDALHLYTRDTLMRYGYVPYEIIMVKGQLTSAMRNGNKDSILFYAADLCHYISDANVPLHTSSNYDGQQSHQNGIHALWETQVPDIELDHYNLYSPHRAEYLKDPAETVWAAIRQAHNLLKTVFEYEKSTSRDFSDSAKYREQTRNGKTFKSYGLAFAKAYGKSLGNSVNEQLIRSANMVADFWYSSWVDAGKPNLDPLLSAPITNSDIKKMNTENLAFKKNRLIENNMLIARKAVAGE